MSQVSLRASVCLILVGLLTLAPAAVQAQQIDFTKGKSHFPNFFSPYSPLKVPQASFQNSMRLEDLIRDGKLILSLQDAIYLVLENNLDIAIQRYGPALAETDLLRTLGGGATRGAAGTGGLTSLGGGPTNLDPTLSVSFNEQHLTQPQANVITTGQASLSRTFKSLNFSLSKGFATGTALTLSSNNSRTKTNSLFALLNPQVNSSFRVTVSQPLLSGFGFATGLRFIRVARNSIKISDQQFAQQVMDIVSTVKRASWELIFARENTKVTQQSFELAEKLYRDNQRQVEIGTLAPLELIRAEAEVARTRQNLIAAQTNALQQQNILKDMIARNPGDQLLATVEIEPIDRPEVPTTTEVIPVQDAIQIAMERRPEIAQDQLSLKNSALEIRATKSSMLPSLGVFASWAGNGLSGNSIDPVTGAPINSGLGASLTQVVQGDFPDYQFGFQLSIPLRNRVAQADMARAQIQQRRTEVQARRRINTIIINVRNSQIALQQNRSQIDAAVKARELQEATLSAEQKRFQLGASTIFLVIQAQRDLAQARSSEIRALVDYQRSLIDFDRALGRTLERSKITLQEAKTGFVTASASNPRPGN